MHDDCIWQRSLRNLPIFVLVSITITACAPAQYMPRFDDYTLQQKQGEISNQRPRDRQSISEDPKQRLTRIYNQLEPHAEDACIQIGEKIFDSSCSNWTLVILDDENFNAFAAENREISVTTEVFRYVKSDDELAFILSHEMSHHILNHVAEDWVNATVTGALTGLATGLLLGSVAVALGADEDVLEDVIEVGVEGGYEIGHEAGRLAFSIDQESEADKLALEVVNLAGYSVNEARNIMMYVGADANELKSDHTDTHPSGPERLAAFDLYIKQISFGRSDDLNQDKLSPSVLSSLDTQPSPKMEPDIMDPKQGKTVSNQGGNDLKIQDYVIPELGLTVRDYMGFDTAKSRPIYVKGALTETLGVVVTEVDPNGRAAELGVKTNHRIVQYTDRCMTSRGFVLKNGAELASVARKQKADYFKNFRVKDATSAFDVSWTKMYWIGCL